MIGVSIAIEVWRVGVLVDVPPSAAPYLTPTHLPTYIHTPHPHNLILHQTHLAHGHADDLVDLAIEDRDARVAGLLEQLLSYCVVCCVVFLGGQ